MYNIKQEAEFELFRIIEDTNDNIHIKYNGIHLKPVRPLLAIIAKTLGIPTKIKNTKQVARALILELNAEYIQTV